MSSSSGRVLREGFVGGLIAYFAVVVVFAVLNLLGGRSMFHTAAAMGGFLLPDHDASAAVVVEAAPVFAYNGVHLLGSVAVALLAAFLVHETDRHHSLWYASLMILIAATIYSIVVLGVFGVEVGAVIGWPSALIGTAAWITAMTGYFLSVHRDLLGSLKAESVAEE